MNNAICTILLAAVVSSFIFQYPVEGGVRTSGYGVRLRNGTPELHQALDLAVPVGTAVRPTITGIVSDIGYHSAYGHFIEISSLEGAFKTRFYHLDSKAEVSIGQKVYKETIVAYSGNSGSNTTGPHLHIQLELFMVKIPVHPFIIGNEFIEKKIKNLEFPHLSIMSASLNKYEAA